MCRSATLLNIGVALTILLLHAESRSADTNVRWSTAVLRQKPEWYASAQARALAWARKYEPPSLCRRSLITNA